MEINMLSVYVYIFLIVLFYMLIDDTYVLMCVCVRARPSINFLCVWKLLSFHHLQTSIPTSFVLTLRIYLLCLTDRDHLLNRNPWTGRSNPLIFVVINKSNSESLITSSRTSFIADTNSILIEYIKSFDICAFVRACIWEHVFVLVKWGPHREVWFNLVHKSNLPDNFDERWPKFKI